MLTRAQNAELTGVGSGTIMGDLLRRYWIPALLSSELEADGRPRRFRLLGEDILAFRDTNGTVGLVEPLCAHRGAALYFGRNEKGGLRCAFHGWKYDVNGQCLETPNESLDNMKDKIRLVSWPAREAGGVVWAYLGPKEMMPPLPDFEWMKVPASHRLITYRVQHSNWVQGLEGGVDTSHISFLHAPLDAERPDDTVFSVAKSSLRIRMRDGHPRFETHDTDFGVMIGARRTAQKDRWDYWRISHFLMPFYNMVAPGGTDPTLPSKAWVPADDGNCVNWSITWHPTRPLVQTEIDELRRGLGAHYCDYLAEKPGPYGWALPRASADNDYLIDWDRQQKGMFSGILGVGLQDQAMQESAGPICDRTREHLGGADLAVSATRHRLRDAAEALREKGVAPPGSADGSVFLKRGAHMVIRPDQDWVKEAAHLIRSDSGMAFANANRKVEEVNAAMAEDAEA